MTEINSLNVLNLRKIDCIAPQFAKTKIVDGEWNILEIETWIQNKLKSRFYIHKYPTVGDGGKIKSTTLVGFEDHKELTYFMLACPFLRRL